MTLEEYNEQINALNSTISALKARANELEASGKDWIADAANDVCNQILKSKRQACETERARKHALGTARLAEASSIRSEISSLETQRSKLIEQRDEAAVTANQVSQTLAAQGTTIDAVEEVAESQANAIETTASLTAQAKSAAIVTDAEADADNKRKIGYIILAIGIVVTVVVGFFLYKRLKKVKAKTK